MIDIQYSLPLFIVLISLESSSLNMEGAISALLMAYLILLTQNVWWFFYLLSFFIIAMLGTKYGEKKKEKKKLIQQIRGSKNVMANGGIALLMALLGGTYAVYGFVGALAAATADTTASEIGVLSKTKPVMITTLKPAKAGVNGAVSLKGTVAATIAAFTMGLIALTICNDLNIIWIATVSGVIGQFADSVIGAIFENKGYWGNSITNMFATTVGAITALLLTLLI